METHMYEMYEKVSMFTDSVKQKMKKTAMSYKVQKQWNGGNDTVERLYLIISSLVTIKIVWKVLKELKIELP